ncbi:MAG: FG-GAP repeat protein [Anaerolineae bacterium]|nr:FG-GAP repeat protein [Anaerolineae bacterium]
MKTRLLLLVLIPALLLTGWPIAQPSPIALRAATPPPPAESTPIPEAIAGMPGVTDDWWAQVQALLRNDLYGITAEQTEGEALTYRGYNPDQRFDFTVNTGGVRLAQAVTDPESPPDPGWALELRTTGYGYEGDVHPLPTPAETTTDGNRLEFHRAGLTEWYINDERGLEQGFTLDAPPQGEGETLVLELALDTGLSPTLVGDAEAGAEQAVEFTQPEGNVVLLRYSDLSAYDAAGRALTAHMALSGCEDNIPPESCTLALVIDAAGAAYPLTIDPLIATPSWSATGENSSDHFGISVASAGDVNGDGYADLVVGAHLFNSGMGKVYVYHGSPAGLDGLPAWFVYGEYFWDFFGYSVATAGDVNGDGYADLVVGALHSSNNGTGVGKAYVYHGSPAGLGQNNKEPDWTAVGENDADEFGSSVATAGDVNGDGYADLVVGAPENNDAGYSAGKAYVYHGSPAGLGAAPAWTATGENTYDRFGYSVATAGKVNDDRYADLVVAAPHVEGRGKVYVYHGSPAGLGATPAWIATGEDSYDSFGSSVATAGDVNGDGNADLVVGAPGYDDSRGKVRIYHGSAAGLGENDREADWITTGENAYDCFGSSVATAGDVNGDGNADLVVGAYGYDDYRGKAYVYHGSDVGLGATPAWTAIGEHTGDYYTGDSFGYAVATVGDVNGDGYADLVVGAYRYDGNRGKAYVYYGTRWGLNPAFDWTAGGENAYDRFGYAVGTAGDVNGDGFADLIVGAYGYDGGRGRAYLFQGSSAGLSAVPAWSVLGEGAGDNFARAVGAAGDVNGDGYADVIIGAPYNDTGGTNAGKAYLYYGSMTGLTPGPADWMATGVYAGDNFGTAVSTAGDVTGDGYADLVVGATGYPQGTGNGKAYVYYGSPVGPTSGPANWTASGEHAADHFGFSVGTAGDVNGDGCADLVAGAWGYDENKGKAYVYHGSTTGLGTAPAWTTEGVNAGDYFGWSTAMAGDVDGDGYADLVAGAWGYDDAANTDAGRVDVYHGGVAGLGATSAFTATGQNDNDTFGFAVATAGDVDGDGYADLIVGAQGYATAAGAAYLYHGSATGLDAARSWTTSGANPGDRLGSAVGTAGDVNGDGFSDLVAGAWGYDDPAHTNVGRVYVYYGAALKLGGVPAFTAFGESTYNYFENAVAAGDVNGDGYADVAVGARGYDGWRGKVYVYYGSAAGPGQSGRDPDWTAVGENTGDACGMVAAAGDVNGDGYADLAVAATDYLMSTGKVYVYYGSATGLGDTPAWTATGITEYDQFGGAIATAGDVNGDGYADLAIGAIGYDGWRGKLYIFYGSAAGLENTPVWTAVGDTIGFARSVSTAGDVNGDGFADLVVGHGLYDGWRGKAYVYYGSSTGLGQSDRNPDWIAIGEGDSDRFGQSVGSAGDVNGDGYADMVVWAYGYDNWRGRIYVYHGSPQGLDVPFATFSGGDEGETNEGAISSVGTAGDVNGDGFTDLIVGAGRAFTDTGRVYLYYGSPLGLSAGFDPVAAGETEGDRFGSSVATVGDVNGDGYADVIASAGGYITYTGKVYIYQGNNGGGRRALATQVRGDISGITVQPWGPSYTRDSFGVALQAVHPLGRGRAKLQVQVCPSGVPFGDALCIEKTSNNWTAVSGEDGVVLKETVRGLTEGALYRWRARVLYDSPFYAQGPWRRVMAQALEGDVRSTRLPADLTISKTIFPTEPVATGSPITYTLTFTSSGPARGIVITDILSSDITDITVTSSGALISDTGHTPCCVWSVQDLEASEGGVIIITGVAQAERFANTAVIAGTSPDPNPDNNSATVQTHIPGVLYVKADATGADNGQSWANAYTDLQDALHEAAPGDQIWIAEGVYKPTATEGDLRTASFHLTSGVAIHGGFDGTEVWLHERDTASHPTILSGDVGTPNNPADNVFHVVDASGVDAAAVLEGVIIAYGNADGTDLDGVGGGMISIGGSPTLINVLFAGNSALQGGAIYLEDSVPLLTNVAFSGNAAEEEGGALYNTSSSPILINVTFSANDAYIGGGIFNISSTVTLTNAILWGNTPDQIANDATSSATVNYSDIQGGHTGTGNIASNPQFADFDGPDDVLGTPDDNLRIHTTYRHPSLVIDAGLTTALPADTWDLDGDGNTAEPLPRDLSDRWRLIGFKSITPTVDMGAYEATIVDVLAKGGALFEQGEAFRLENLQLLSSDTMAEALQNYANFNDGEWYYAFCGNYSQVDADGYCPDSDPPGIRNILLDAIDLYRVALGWPTQVFTPTRGMPLLAWEAGGQGVLSSTTEIANVHMIFGNEYLVDATDYRFSTAGIPYADQIINQELDELGEAQRQFELTIDLVFRAFNEWGVGAYCNNDQFEQFGMASGLLVSTLNETAARYFMLRNSAAALDVYNRAYTQQYMHLMALSEMAGETDTAYLQNGSWEMLNNLSQLRERAQAIHEGLDFFGFAPDYVPLQSYEQLRILTEGPTGDTGLLGTARDLEDQARDAQRTFDTNKSDMDTELDNLTVELNSQLFELCGNDVDICEGGLMLQNLDTLDVAGRRAALALLHAQNLTEQIVIEEERAGQVISVRLALGQEISAAELAKGVLRAVKTTRTSVSSSEDQISLGIEIAAEAWAQAVFKFPFPETEAGVKASLKRTVGWEHAWTWIDSTSTVWDPAEANIGQWESIQALKQAQAEAEIEGANSAALVRNLLLQQAEAVQEFYIAAEEFNTLVDEHNHLAERRSRLLSMREQAINRVASHNSHLLNPAYRIWRDSLTIQSNQAHALAAQFAYLTARAAEYELLTPYPNLGKIFRARTSNDIRIFLDGLAVWVQALDLPGQLNRYPYTLSLARDLWGLTDQIIDPEGVLSASERDQKRYEKFQELLQANLGEGKLEAWFTTALDQQRAEGQYLFSPNIWNNRIAGIGMPLAANEGVKLNIVTRQSGVSDVEVLLIHGSATGGAEAYRNVNNETAYYDPDTAVPVGYVLPAGLDPENTTVVLRPAINGVGGIANSGLLNLSVAASSWTLRIPSTSRGNLDYSQIEDIQIILDTTGRALPGLEAQAVQDAQNLQAGLEMEPATREVTVNTLAVPTLALVAPPPSLPNQIGGAYFGNVMITSPITVAIQILDLYLWNDGGVLTGTVDIERTALYTEGIHLQGVTDNEIFSLTSDPFTTTIEGRTVTQTLTLAGHAEDGGDVLKAVYTGTIENLLPTLIVAQGGFVASRPGVSGGERLVLTAGSWSIQPGNSTVITATLYDADMEPITETHTITFTTDLGTVTPQVTQTVNGEAVVTFNAGTTLGQATVLATTGKITGSARIQVSDAAPPQVDFTGTPLTGGVPLTVTFADLTLGLPNAWIWDFGDGNFSDEQDPTHVYTSTGIYTVTLTASNALDIDTRTKPGLVIVASEGPGAHFQVHLPLVLRNSP